MKYLDIQTVLDYVAIHIGEFHQKRLEKLENLKLEQILLRKNPYLFKAKNILTAEALVKNLLDAHLSSQEETIFGEFLESLAIFVCSQIYSGKKSELEGIDLEFVKDDIYYLVQIKSGPNWANSSQIKKMQDCFKNAKKIIAKTQKFRHIMAVNGCCYGRETQMKKQGFQKLCGQCFWEFISGDTNFYLAIIEPLGYQAKQKNEEFLERYAQIINRFTAEFYTKFCTNRGSINWELLVQFNSSAT